MAIDVAEVRRIARLACLEPDRLDLDTLSRQLRSILDHVALLDEVDVEGTPPTSQATSAGTRRRDDEPVAGPGAEEALRNAPDASEGHFRVPSVIE